MTESFRPVFHLSISLSAAEVAVHYHERVCVCPAWGKERGSVLLSQVGFHLVGVGWEQNVQTGRVVCQCVGMCLLVNTAL